MTFDIEKMVAASYEMATTKWNRRTFNDLGDLLPEDQDPTVLFKRNWLARGQVVAIVGSTGIGKSSIVDQMAYNWANGRDFLASPMKPLKIAIVQAEDSDRDLKEQRNGMRQGLTQIDGWSCADVEDAETRIDIPTDFIGLSGEEFLDTLRDYQHDLKFDFIFVNPLQRYFGADISNQGDASPFCAGIDAIIKNPECACGLGMVMHTAKMKSGQKDERANVDDYAEYLMGGSHEWADWSRAIIGFLKHDDDGKYFDFKAAKRGSRLGWTDRDGNPTLKRMFKHSAEFIYWQEVTDPDEIAAVDASSEADDDRNRKPKGKRGRPSKRGMDIEEQARVVSQLFTAECVNRTRDDFARYFWEKNNRENTIGEWSLVFEELIVKSESYGFKTEEIETSNHVKVRILR